MNCDFGAVNEISIQVHRGRCHGAGFECGICDFRADSLESLNIHLNTCEGFECDKCSIRVYNISYMKEHKNGKHGAKDHLCIRHGKLDRNTGWYFPREPTNFVRKKFSESQEILRNIS